MNPLHRPLFLWLQDLRIRECLKHLDRSAATLLDLGSGNGRFVQAARRQGFDARGTDRENDIATATTQADIVTCFEVLEHLSDPVRAMQNLARLYRRQLIVTVPSEPVFSLLRLGWEPEHWWAITPAALRHYLGAPVIEKKIVFRRYYLSVWQKAS